ncbi:MAG: cell division FtsA domain-containing protein [Nitrospira sp.]|nr:cell division FtsA domain-containing protein [Nitrospira sp.]
MKNWSWVESAVDRKRPYIKINYGKIVVGPVSLIDVAIVGTPEGNVFPVQFLINNSHPDYAEVIKKVRSELDFYLVEKGEPDPWRYALYHCTTASNIYSIVHWIRFDGDMQDDAEGRLE